MADTNTAVELLIGEFREGYQIPSYISDSALIANANESIGYFANLGEVVLVDPVTRDLIKNRMFYSYNHQTALFASDFAQDILTWQFAQIGGEKLD